jgi:hypothetical protein
MCSVVFFVAHRDNPSEAVDFDHRKGLIQRIITPSLASIILNYRNFDAVQGLFRAAGQYRNREELRPY